MRSILPATLRRTRKRSKKGAAITAEYAATMFVLFLVIFFPLMNLGTIFLRSFFLWFAANQAVLIGSKAKTWQTAVTITEGGTSVTYQPAITLATDYANRVRTSFLGFAYDPASSLSPNPYVEIVMAPIGDATPIANTASPLASPPDVTKYVPHIRVTIDGLVSPLTPMHLVGLNIPGLTSPMHMRVRSEALFENPPGLTL